MTQTEQTVDRAVPDSWRDRLANGELEPALTSYLRFGPEEPGVQTTLEDLHALLNLVRSKAFARAERMLEQLDNRPDWFDWNGFENSFRALRDAAAAVDEREPDRCEELLNDVTHVLFRAEAANMRGTALIFRGEFEAAREQFDQALLIDPKHYRAVTNLGNAALEAGDLDGAIAFYERAISLNADFANAHHNLGVAWRRKGRIGKSIAALKAGQKAQQRFDQAEAREQLGRMTRGVTGKAAGSKYIKWALYALVAAGVYWFLSSRGTI